MKKCISFILALILAFALAVPALALGATGSDSIDITAKYDDSAVTDKPVYKVTLEWNTYGEITYKAGQTMYSWDADALEYDSTATPGQWTISGARIDFTVRNRSNRPVDVQFANPQGVGGVDISGSYTKSTLELGTAATGGYTGVGEEQVDTSVYTITDITGAIDSSGVIATIAVTIIGK